MNTNRELKRIKKQLGLTAKKIAKILEVTESCVCKWLLKPSAKGFIKMPAPMLALLKLKLKIGEK